MDERIAIWNILHDGEITAVSEEGDTLTMFVSIPFLRRRLKPLGDSFVLTIGGLTRAECSDFRGATSSATPISEVLEIGTPAILSTESASMPVIIETSLGQMVLDFQSLRFALDTGQETNFQTIERLCDEYWTEWEAKSGRGA